MEEEVRSKKYGVRSEKGELEVKREKGKGGGKMTTLDQDLTAGSLSTP
jgi:hypothetical protein